MSEKRRFTFAGFLVLIILILFSIFPVLYYFLTKTINGKPVSMLPFFSVWFDYVVFFGMSLLFGFFASYKLFVKKIENKELFLMLGKVFLVTYSLFLFFTTISRFTRYLSEAVDVFYYHKVIWQISEFKIPFYSFNPPIPAWGDHFEPIIFFIAPLYWFIQNAELLMIIQAAVAISGVIPLYLIGKHFLKSRFLGIALGFSYVMFGGFQFGFAYGFHPIVLLPPVFLWMYYFYLKQKYISYLILILLSLFVKEEVSFIMFFWGLYVLFVRKNIKFSFPAILSGALWYILCFRIIFPHFKTGGFGHWGQYGGEGLGGMMSFMFFHPVNFISTLITPSYKIDTIFHSFGAFGFLLFLTPQTLIIVIPSLLEKLLSSNIAGANGAHYSSAIAGVTVVSTVESLLFVLKRKFFIKHKMSRVFFGSYLLYIATCATLIYGYWGYSPFFVENRIALPDAYVTMLNNVINSIPENASVSAQYQIVPHITKYYKKVTTWPDKNFQADYVLVDVYLPPVILTARDLNTALEDMDKNPKYKLVMNANGIVVYRKK